MSNQAPHTGRHATPIADGRTLTNRLTGINLRTPDPSLRKKDSFNSQEYRLLLSKAQAQLSSLSNDDFDRSYNEGYNTPQRTQTPIVRENANEGKVSLGAMDSEAHDLINGIPRIQYNELMKSQISLSIPHVMAQHGSKTETPVIQRTKHKHNPQYNQNPSPYLSKQSRRVTPSSESVLVFQRSKATTSSLEEQGTEQNRIDIIELQMRIKQLSEENAQLRELVSQKMERQSHLLLEPEGSIPVHIARMIESNREAIDRIRKESSSSNEKLVSHEYTIRSIQREITEYKSLDIRQKATIESLSDEVQQYKARIRKLEIENTRLYSQMSDELDSLDSVTSSVVNSSSSPWNGSKIIVPSLHQSAGNSSRRELIKKIEELYSSLCEALDERDRYLKELEHYQTQAGVLELYKKRVYELEQEFISYKSQHEKMVESLYVGFDKMLNETKVQLCQADENHRQRDNIQLELLNSLKQKISELVSQIRQTKEEHIAEKMEMEAQFNEKLLQTKSEMDVISKRFMESEREKEEVVQELSQSLLNMRELQSKNQTLIKKIEGLNATIDQLESLKKRTEDDLIERESEVEKYVALNRELHEQVEILSATLSSNEISHNNIHFQLLKYKQHIEKLKMFVVSEFQQSTQLKSLNQIMGEGGDFSGRGTTSQDDGKGLSFFPSEAITISLHEDQQDAENEDLNHFLLLAKELKEVRIENKKLHDERDAFCIRVSESQRQYTHLESILQQTASTLEKTRETFQELSKQHESLKLLYNSSLQESESLRESIKQMIETQERNSHIHNSSFEHSKQIDTLHLTIQGLGSENTLREQMFEEIQKRVNSLHEEKSSLLIELNQARVEIYEIIRLEEYWKQTAKESLALLETYKSTVSKLIVEKSKGMEGLQDRDHTPGNALYSQSQAGFPAHVMRRLKLLDDDYASLSQRIQNAPSSMNGIKLASSGQDVLFIPKSQYIGLSSRMHSLHQLLWEYDKALSILAIDYEKSRAMAMEARQALKTHDESVVSMIGSQPR